MAFSKFDMHKEGCGVEIPTNARPALSDFYVDRSRLRRIGNYEYEPAERNGEKGKIVPTTPRTVNIMNNVRDAAGAMGARSSYSNHEDHDGRLGGMNTDHLGGNNPLRRRRSDG